MIMNLKKPKSKPPVLMTIPCVDFESLYYWVLEEYGDKAGDALEDLYSLSDYSDNPNGKILQIYKFVKDKDPMVAAVAQAIFSQYELEELLAL